MRARARAFAHLARWLAPVTPESRRPGNVRRRSAEVPAHGGRASFEAWLYGPTDRPPSGAYLVVPGLHFLGPADPRLDRFLHVLAGAGFLVLAPFLPDFTALRVAPELATDAKRAFRVLLEHPELPEGARPGVFSISFGSLPAIQLAASPTFRDRVGGLILFGGYADWNETIRFSLTGEVDGVPLHVRDPLNQPAVFLNVIENLPNPPRNAARLAAAWHRYVRATWGRPELKAVARHAPIAYDIAAEFEGHDRHLFLVGCGLEPGGLALVEAALAREETGRDYLDPLPHAKGIRCPVYLFHGRDDDVIPYTQADRLARAMPDPSRTRAYLTGLFAHTGTGRLSERLGNVPAAGRELITMVRMVGAMVAAGTAKARS